MGGGGGFLGLGGGGSKPDNSAYEFQLAQQREATRKQEEKAAQAKAEADDTLKRQQAGRTGSLLTGAGGDTDETAVKRRSLLGAGA